MRHSILLLYEELNKRGIEWTLGPISLAFSLGLTYEPNLDLAIYVEDIARIDIKELLRWGIIKIFKVSEPGFSNRAIYVRGLPCISLIDILRSLDLNPNYPLIRRILEKSSSFKKILNPTC
ncbi:MAG: hypothetical protein GXO26_09705 [Crenarchaeota archaeon]|nr:hypothetical protein [Thermoproteota archaeon]